MDKDTIKRLRDPHGKFSFQGGSPFAIRIADELEYLQKQLTGCQILLEQASNDKLIHRNIEHIVRV